MDSVLLFELSGGLDALPSGSDLNEYPGLVNSNGFVECQELLGLFLGAFFIKRESSIDFGRDTARDDLEDLLAKLDELSRSGVKIPRSRGCVK